MVQSGGGELFFVDDEDDLQDTVRMATKLYGIWEKGPSDPGEA